MISISRNMFIDMVCRALAMQKKVLDWFSDLVEWHLGKWLQCQRLFEEDTNRAYRLTMFQYILWETFGYEKKFCCIILSGIYVSICLVSLKPSLETYTNLFIFISSLLSNKNYMRIGHLLDTSNGLRPYNFYSTLRLLSFFAKRPQQSVKNH